MIKIRKNIVPKHIADKVTYKGTNSKRYLIIHETDNENKGANADAHGRLQANGNSRSASWHYSVDDKEVVQSFSDNTQCWAAGNSHYNKHGIQIEICVNSDGNYKKAVENTVALAKKLMAKYGIPASRVLQHHDASLKNCPRYLRSGAKGFTWAGFKNMLTGIKTVKPTTPKTKPVTTTKKGNMKTNSIVEYLDSIGVDSSYSNRVKLAKKHGIKNYKGTASQNLSLLAKLRDGNTKSSSKPKTSTKKKYPLPNGVLKRGSKGNSVKQLQRALNAANFNCGAVDGIYGAKTEDAVRRFQMVYDAYNVDGIYGPRTKTRLDKKVN